MRRYSCLATTSTSANGGENMGELTIQVPTPGQELAKLLREVDKSSPEPGAVAKLAEHLARHPDIAALLGDLAEMTQRTIIDRSFTQPSVRTAITVRLESMRAELGYDTSSSELEKSLIRHLLLCWLRLFDCELRYQATMQGGPSMEEGRFWEQKLSANQKRYLRACESLAKVRRLGVKIQVNVANQQIVSG